METYALVYKNKVVDIKRSINFKPSGNWFEVVYPSIDDKYDNLEYLITQKPFSQWDVDENGNVTVAYDIIKLSFNEILEDKISKLPEIRDSVVSAGIEVEIDGRNHPIMTFNDARIALDQASLDAERRPTNWFKYWKFADGSRLKIDSSLVEYIRSKVADHVEMCFRYEQIKEEELKSSSDFEQLMSVNIYAGWPLTYLNIDKVNNQQNLEHILEE